MKPITLFYSVAIILSILLGVQEVARGQTSTVSPNESSDEYYEDDEDDSGEEERYQISERVLMAAEFFPDPMSIERALKFLKRAVELIEKPKTKSKYPESRSQTILRRIRELLVC